MPVLSKPPSKTTITRRKHAAWRRARIVSEGGRRIDLLLERDVGDDLAHLERETGGDATTVISRLIRDAAAASRASG